MYPDHTLFDTKTYDQWKEFYPDAKEEIPDEQDMPPPKGDPVCITAYKDADHAHDMLT